jgi:hypothetical protein
VHTLNASGLALPRIIITILEQNQEADGRVKIPRPSCLTWAAASTSNLRADPSSPALAALLARDPAWAAYLIADLAPPYAKDSTWFLADEAVVLLYRAFLVPCSPCSAAPRPRPCGARRSRKSPRGLAFAVCRPEHRGFVDATMRFADEHAMFRMRLNGTPAEAGPAMRLGPSDLAALRGLYEDGAARQEIPDFFEDSMVGAGLYHGVRDAGELVAVAGTHVLTATVAAVGNVYVRQDARGKGLAGRVTAAVARELRGDRRGDDRAQRAAGQPGRDPGVRKARVRGARGVRGGVRPADGARPRGLIPSRAFHSPWRPDRLAQNPPDSPSRTPQRLRRGGPFGVGRIALPRLFQGYLFLGVAGIVLAVFVFTNILLTGWRTRCSRPPRSSPASAPPPPIPRPPTRRSPASSATSSRASTSRSC